MPTSLSDTRQELIDLLEPRERLVFDALERQMELTHELLRAHRRAMWCVIAATGVLSVSLLTFALALILYR